MPYLLTLIGLVLLYWGGEWLVFAARWMARRMKISPLVVGLTVVAFGTGAPELAVSLMSIASAKADLAVGNVIGSNILNLLLVLGLSATIAPLLVQRQLVRREVPCLVAVTAATWLMASDGQLGRIDSLLLFVTLIGSTVWSIRGGRQQTQNPDATVIEESSEVEVPPSWSRLSVQLVTGVALLVLGSNCFVDGASEIASRWGMSDLLVGLTVVAVGTSLPEISASVIAVLRGQRDIAVGNVIGSNLFNLCGVLGISGLFTPSAIEVSQQARNVDFPAMLVITLLCWPLICRGKQIERWTGIVFLAGYVTYVLVTVHFATQ